MASLMLVNPKRRRKARRNMKTAANPRRKRARRKAARGYTVGNAPVRRRKLNPKRGRRRARRNPKFSIAAIQRQAIMPAAIGGVGALALDVAFGALPIPANFKTGAMGSVAKLVGAVVLGKLAGKALGARAGEAVTVGAVTIQAYNLIKGFAQKAMPTLPMGEYISGMDAALPYYTPQAALGYANAGQFIPDPYSNHSGMSEYISGTDYNESY